MNCDDAFDALTDPVSANAAELTEHLAKCPRCRVLKQVLEPALSLLCGDLPAEPATSAALPHEGREKDAVAPRKAFLSVEAIGVAEAAAARLASLSAPSGSRPTIRLPRNRFSARVLQGVLCAAFGGLAVLCSGLWSGKSDVARQPSLVPSVIPAGAIPAGVCTRNATPQKATKAPGESARAVILSCVACHMRDQQPRSERLPTSLFQSPRRLADPELFVCGQTEVVNDRGPILKADHLATGPRLGHEYA
jgi:hypothetical protein